MARDHAVKMTVTIPASVYLELDEILAERVTGNRSQLVAEALRYYLDGRSRERLVEAASHLDADAETDRKLTPLYRQLAERGTIRWATQGDDTRPYLLLQADALTATSSVIGFPVTVAAPAAGPPATIPLPPESTSLDRPLWVRVTAPVTLPRDTLGQTLGAVTADDLRRIERATVAALGVWGTTAQPDG